MKAFRFVAMILLFLSVSINLFSQENENVLIVRGLVDEDYEPLRNVKITVLNDSKKVKEAYTDTKGEFELQLGLNKEFTLTFTKEGYVSKKVFVNSAIPEGETGNWAVEFPLGLFKMYPGLDISALDNPVTKIQYIEKENGFGYDRLYTEKMMGKVEKIMRQLEQLKEEAYRRIIRKGDKHFDNEEYSEAITQFKKALEQRPDDRYPKKRLEDAEEMLEKLKELRELYENAIARGDKYFSQKKYAESKSAYNEAIKYDEDEEYPRQQIRKINEILAQQEAKEQARQENLANYNDFIQKGDNLFSIEEYQKAKENYQNALGIFPEKPYPKEQISKIDKLLADMQAQQELNDQYNSLIQVADNNFEQQNYNTAKSNYQEALDLKSSEPYPKQQIEKINEILASQKAAEEEYNRLIQSADLAFSNEDYQSAKKDYNAALGIKQEQYPKDQIDKIDEILEDRNKQLAEYKRLIKEANEAFEVKQYNQAKASYSEALFIKPDEQYPKDQIAKIDSLLAQLKKEEDTRKEKEKAYNEAVRQADAMFTMEEYRQSKSLYNKALGIKPEEQYPKDRIAEIDEILKRLMDEKAAYENAITKADKLFNEESFESSKSSYQKALEIRSNEQYPKDQIAKIDDILAQLRAEKERQAATEEKYRNAITTADQLFNAEEYEDSRTIYNEALNIKPGESYPKEQIAKIDQILEERRMALERKYNEIVKRADNLFSEEAYQNAKTTYQDALDIKPNESYPKEQIEKIEKILADLEEKRKEQERINRLYTEEINKADKFYDDNFYLEAKKHYENALEYKSNEEYPKNKLKVIENLLADLEKTKNQKSSQKASKSKKKKEEPQLQDFSEFKSDKERKEFLNKLAKEYPRGKTVERYNLGNRTITRIIMNYDGMATDYRTVRHSWGGVYYFKNGRNISQAKFSVETKERD